MSDKPMNKSQLRQALAEAAGITSTQSEDILTALFDIATQQLQIVGSFTIPNICKITKATRPAKPERQMKSPLTGQMITVKAKPETNSVKIRPVKKIKDAVL